ncbi:MAG TPA: phosphatase PAP2 family protein [Gaiellaceae bacterium]|nr:phosphatase PAP2 family protein [Gaiellaceae bacterium]
MARSGHAQGMEDGRAGRAAQRTTAFVAAVWHDQRRRRLALGALAAVAAAFAFARVTEDYLTNDPLARWDVTFSRWLAGERTTPGVDFFRVVTFFGSPAVGLAIAAVVCLALYRRGRVVDAALLPVVLGGAELLNLILKLSFHRARPEVAFVHLDTYSFPSGHAMISTAAYGALAYLAWSHVRTTHGRVLVGVGTALLLALIGFSRIYLGVHYLSDVLAGIAGGVFWLSVSIVLQTLYAERLAARFRGSRLDRLARRATRSR